MLGRRQRQLQFTDIEVTAGNVHDSEAAVPLVDKQPEERKPGTVLSDTAYGTGENRAEMAKRQVERVAGSSLILSNFPTQRLNKINLSGNLP